MPEESKECLWTSLTTCGKIIAYKRLLILTKWNFERTNSWSIEETQQI